MNHTLFMNSLIVLLVAAMVLITHQPLALLGLMYLMEFPYALHDNHLKAKFAEQDEDDEEDSQAMGFTQDVR